MLDSVRSLVSDATICLDAAEKVTSESLRTSILLATREALVAATELLPRPEPKPKRYVLPKKEDSARSSYTPWTTKNDLNIFRSEMLSFLRGAVPERNHKDNMAEVAKLWSMYKGADTLEEIVQCAKEAVMSA
jgi:hypothetical protein